MALEHINIQKTQDELNQLLGVTSIGTPFSYVKRIETLGPTVILANGEEALLKEALESGCPVLIPVDTGQLQSYWSSALKHAVLAIGYDDRSIYLNDPAFVDAPKKVDWLELMLACEPFDHLFAIIKVE